MLNPKEVEVEGLSKLGTHKGTVQRRMLAVLLDHEARDELSTSGRFLFYEMEGLGWARKTVATDPHRRGNARTGAREQCLIDALIWLRDKGIIPWDWIEDETRTLHQWRYADTVKRYVVDSLDLARINPWDGEPPLILCESRSLEGVLRRLAAEYLCPIAPTNGQAGGFLHTAIAPLLIGNERPVLYLGDWDHQGHQIEDNTRRVLEQVTGRKIDWLRLAITEDQIKRRGLDPIWKKDERYTPTLEHEAWEAEALGQTTIQSLVREALDALLPEPLADVRDREEVERAEIAEWLERLG